MNIQKSRELYVKKVVESIPPNIKPTNYLMDVLDISKVSAYRRLKCILPFTYDEMIVLSKELDFSLDDIIHADLNEEKAIFSYYKYDYENIHEFFVRMLNNIYGYIKNQIKTNENIAIISINHLWIIYVMGYEHLLKFYYFRWMHQMSFNSYRLLYSEIKLSNEILDLSNKIKEQIYRMKKTVFIIDKNLFFNTLHDIQYFYRRNIIGYDELTNIKNDFEKIIQHTESHVLLGKNTMGNLRSFYLSSLNIYSNSFYIECEESTASFFYQYNPYPFMTLNANLCAFHREWLETLKKYSILMTASNEALQIDFFSKQRQYLSDLIEDKDLIAT